MSDPTLENIAARAGRYPSTAERFGDKEAKLAESTKTYVDTAVAGAGGGLSTVVFSTNPDGTSLEANTYYIYDFGAGVPIVTLPDISTTSVGDVVKFYVLGAPGGYGLAVTFGSDLIEPGSGFAPVTDVGLDPTTIVELISIGTKWVMIKHLAVL